MGRRISIDALADTVMECLNDYGWLKGADRVRLSMLSASSCTCAFVTAREDNCGW